MPYLQQLRYHRLFAGARSPHMHLCSAVPLMLMSLRVLRLFCRAASSLIGGCGQKEDDGRRARPRHRDAGARSRGRSAARQADLPVRRRAERVDSTGLLGLRARAGRPAGAAVGRRPSAAAADVELEAGADGRVQADGLRPELSLHRRRRTCASGSTSRRPASGCRSAATEASRSEYKVAKFQLLPQSENIFLIYKEGWHPAEMSADNPKASGSGPRRRRRCRSGTRRRTRRSISSTTRAPTSSRRRSR